MVADVRDGRNRCDERVERINELACKKAPLDFGLAGLFLRAGRNYSLLFGESDSRCLSQAKIVNVTEMM
jgi:hypothetical protein